MKKTIIICGLSIMISACSTLSLTGGEKTQSSDEDPLKTLYLEPVAFSAIPNFNSAESQGFARAVAKSCAPILKKDVNSRYGPSDIGGTVGDWAVPCAAAGDLADRNWLQEYFTAYQVSDNGDVDGLYTGYYEPLLHGSYKKTAAYNTPLYMMPDDLVEVDLGQFSDDLKGKKVSGRVEGQKLVPYADRAGIDNGALDGRDLELVWVDDPVDAFFLHIQGSGQVKMTDGKTLRVGYAGQNGRSYYAIGRELIKRGEIDKEDVSLQSIRRWLTDNPDQAQGLMQLNPSYIFFRKLEGDGPLGAQGVALTPMASLAVDRRIYPYGMPLILQADEPLSDGQIDRLMVAQDTGGAIRGVVRGDFFWGAGEDAALKAGHMKSEGRMWIFLPKTIEIPQNYLQKQNPFTRMITGIKNRIFSGE